MVSKTLRRAALVIECEIAYVQISRDRGLRHAANDRIFEDLLANR